MLMDTMLEETKYNQNIHNGPFKLAKDVERENAGKVSDITLEN